MSFGSLLVKVAAVGTLVIGLVGGVVYASGANQTLTDARSGLVGGAPAAPAGTALPEQDPARQDPQLRAALVRAHYRWSAVSPATHTGDHYTITLTNGPTAQQVALFVMLMDHRAHRDTRELREIVTLAPGERRTFEADNTYGA